MKLSNNNKKGNKLPSQLLLRSVGVIKKYEEQRYNDHLIYNQKKVCVFRQILRPIPLPLKSMAVLPPGHPLYLGNPYISPK